jgi:menaquinone-dependent protoporphyrinogen oxidase
MTARVLVAYGTKMGSTAEIAECIADTLREEGLEVEVRDAAKAAGADGYDGVVVGSAVYMARWRPEVIRFLKREKRYLASRPVWLFHDGPLDRQPEHASQPLPKDVAELAAFIGVQDAVTFGGRLDEHPEGFLARRMAPHMAGDFRDWDAIDSWARKVASGVTEDRAAS